MVDRQPTKPGRIKITFDDGTVKYGCMERADEPTVEGTPLNKNTLFNSNNTQRYVADLPSEAFELIGKVWGTFDLTASNWSSAVDTDGYYTQRIDIGGMSEQYYPSMVPVYSSADAKDDEKAAVGQVDLIETVDGGIIAKSTDIPSLDVRFILVGV